jgi:hypothetical protein
MQGSIIPAGKRHAPPRAITMPWRRRDGSSRRRERAAWVRSRQAMRLKRLTFDRDDETAVRIFDDR